MLVNNKENQISINHNKQGKVALKYIISLNQINDFFIMSVKIFKSEIFLSSSYSLFFTIINKYLLDLFLKNPIHIYLNQLKLILGVHLNKIL